MEFLKLASDQPNLYYIFVQANIGELRKYF